MCRGSGIWYGRFPRIGVSGADLFSRSSSKKEGNPQLNGAALSLLWARVARLVLVGWRWADAVGPRMVALPARNHATGT